MNESILSFPQKSLNPAVWTQDESGNYVLREDVNAVVQQVVAWAQQTFKIPEMGVRLTGSNTSNSYSGSSDLDVHFNSPKLKKGKVDDFNRLFRKKFEQLVAQRPDLGEVNGVRVEIYMQANPYQDLMSVGCYDFIAKKWLVGPEIKPVDFDPYAEYFMKDLKSVDGIIEKTRNVILKMYELAFAMLKGQEKNFKEQVSKKFNSALKEAQKLFNIMRKKRSRKSQPKSPKEAKANRNDKDWQIADSAFKLLDKLGYLGILKTATQAVEQEVPAEEAACSVISAISEKLSSKSLDDSEKETIGQLLELEQQNESAGDMIKISTIAAMMAIGSFLPQNALAKELVRAKREAATTKRAFTANSPIVKQARFKAAVDDLMIGSMHKTNVINAVAMTLWKEARGNEEGIAGREGVASVILNRTGNDPACIIDVIKEDSAFTCVKKDYKGGWTDKTYDYFTPTANELKNPENMEIWKNCTDIALKLVDKKFMSTVGKCNSYLNKKTAKKKAVESWGKKCTLKVGNHHFGYLPEHDPKYVKPGTMTPWRMIPGGNPKAKKAMTVKPATADKPEYVQLKPGDTLGKVAKAYKTTVDELMRLNRGSVKNKNSVKAGMKIRVK